MAKPNGPYKPEEESGGGIGLILAPQFHVILHNDDTHTYDYVIAMLMQLFGKTKEAALNHATEVDNMGVTIVETTLSSPYMPNIKYSDHVGHDRVATMISITRLATHSTSNTARALRQRLSRRLKGFPGVGSLGKT